MPGFTDFLYLSIFTVRRPQPHKEGVSVQDIPHCPAYPAGSAEYIIFGLSSDNNMDITKPFPKKYLKFTTNLMIWLFSCFVVLMYRSVTQGSSMAAPMSQGDKDTLLKFFDPTILWSLLGGCAIVFLVISFVAYKVGTQKTASRVRAVLDQISEETGSVLLNNGSLLMAIAYFTGHGMYAIGSVAAWIGWWVFEPNHLQVPQNDGEAQPCGQPDATPKAAQRRLP